ncbi:hypothetical protein ACOSQ4_032113 [Xanthoceras sorbifolium]
MVVWRIWYHGNRWVHLKVVVPLCGVIDWAKSFLDEFQAIKQPPGEILGFAILLPLACVQLVGKNLTMAATSSILMLLLTIQTSWWD